MLPIAPFTETSGTFVNAEGRAQLQRRRRPAGRDPSGWKVLRVLGNLLARRFRLRASERCATRRFGQRLEFVAGWTMALVSPVRRQLPPVRQGGCSASPTCRSIFADPIARRALRCSDAPTPPR